MPSLFVSITISSHLKSLSLFISLEMIPYTVCKHIKFCNCLTKCRAGFATIEIEAFIFSSACLLSTRGTKAAIEVVNFKIPYEIMCPVNTVCNGFKN